MFIDLFYLMRKRGLEVSPTEWLTFMEALDMGLHNSNFTDFYYLARCTLVKSENNFDKFDEVFLEYFEGLEPKSEVLRKLLEWLDNAKRPSTPIDKAAVDEKWKGMTLEKLMEMLEERLKEQDERHDGGDKWIGTGGTSPFGNSGYNPMGIRIGGESRNKRAIAVAGDRNYRDFRNDETLDHRQMQMAFKKLRQLSANDEGPKDEFKLQETIDSTCRKGGLLDIVYGRPRKNSIKLLMLFDCGGSMEPYARMCSDLFKSVNKANHFKDLKFYYFHNCIYQEIYLTPECEYTKTISADQILRNLKSEYRVIFVGDAAMAPTELFRTYGSKYQNNYEPGIVWLQRFKKRYPRMVWLNPLPPEEWSGGGYDTESIERISREIPMYQLSLKGMEKAFKGLLKAT